MSLPVTTTDTVETPASRLAIVSEFAAKIKENAANAFSDVRAYAPVLLTVTQPPLPAFLHKAALLFLPRT
jgi:hypothetical protein